MSTATPPTPPVDGESLAVIHALTTERPLALEEAYNALAAIRSMASANTIARFESKLDAHRSKLDAHRKGFESKLDAHRKEVESKFDAHRKEVESKFDAHRKAVESKFDAHRKAVESKFDAHREGVESKFDAFRTELNAFRAVVESKFDAQGAQLRMLMWMMGIGIGCVVAGVALVTFLLELRP